MSYDDMHNIKMIFNNNGDIIIINDIRLFILKLNKKENNKNIYIVETIRYSNYYYLKEINNNLFLAVTDNGNNNIIEFYDNKEYKYISSIKIKKSEEVVGYAIINKGLICLNIIKEKFVFIDIKYFGIINIIESDLFGGELIKIKENYFLEFYRRNNKKNAKIKYFNENEEYLKVILEFMKMVNLLNIKMMN